MFLRSEQGVMIVFEIRIFFLSSVRKQIPMPFNGNVENTT